MSLHYAAGMRRVNACTSCVVVRAKLRGQQVAAAGSSSGSSNRGKQLGQSSSCRSHTQKQTHAEGGEDAALHVHPEAIVAAVP